MTKRTKRLLAMMSAKPKLMKISGLPPLTYKAKKAGTLTNYRIYGQTVDGESVGDRTGNLFDGEVELGGLNGATGAEFDSDNRCRSSYILLDAGTYTISISSSHTIGLFIFSSTNVFETFVSYSDSPITFSLETVKKVRFGFSTRYGDGSITPSDISNIMLNAGSTALPYEPYGYKVPVTVSNGTDTLTIPIYLPEQIKKVGDEAEYIDYGKQKFHRISGADLDVTLPELPTLTGTNVLSVGTAVQPSLVEVTGRIRPVPTGGGE